jgi:hypothetical protein
MLRKLYAPLLLVMACSAQATEHFDGETCVDA